MEPPRKTSAIFGLRYLEEEDLEINDIIGCYTAAGNPVPQSYMTEDATHYTTYTDVPDTDSMRDQGEEP